jgi:Concanavalin A-like lectin/glucanases superfamily
MKISSIRRNTLILKTLCLTPFLLAALATHAALTHEWSFNDSVTSTNAVDSVGGSTGALNGGATYPGNGTVVLDGSSGYVYLPNDIVSNYTSVTYEIWTTPTSENAWARLFDFGTSSGGAGTGSGTAGNTGVTWDYLAFADGSGSFHGDLESVTSGEGIILGPAPSVGAYHDVVFTINATNHTAALYDDGAIVSYDTNFLVTPQEVGHTYSDYIGRSQFGADPFYNGSLDEFRIYNSAYTPPQVEADYEAGAGVTSASSGNATAIQFNNLNNTIVGAVLTPVILANYSALTNEVNISTLPGITYSSDNTNVLIFGADGNFHGLAAGTTTIRASYQSLSAALTITVNVQPAVLVNRYSFDGIPGSTTITDSVSAANGTLINGSGTATLNGNGTLTLDGNASSAYVVLPPNLISSLTNATFEIWVENQDPNSDWAELWTFGTNNGSAGINYLTMIPNDPPNHEIRLDEGADIVHASEALPYTNEVCLTVVYNYLAQNGSIYVNGRKLGSGPMNKALYSILDPDNYIGQSQFYGGGDPYLEATLDEFRIYSGAESDLQVAVDAAAGPNSLVSNPGALVSLTVVVSSTNVDIHGLGESIQVLANFANISDVDVTTLSQTTISSGNTSVGTMVNGSFVPRNVGVSTVTATYGGKSGSVALDVVDAEAWPSLVHRWNFKEPAGSTTLTDLVANINGTVNGPMTFTGQEMTTPNPNPVSAANGIPTASSGWVQFPGSKGVVSGLPNEASFEIWVVWEGGGVWQEMFDFGQAATPGVSTGGFQYVMICPDDGANNTLRAEWDENPAYDVTLLGPNPLQVGVLSQIVWSHDQDRQLDKLYLNGQLVASAVNTALWSTLPDTDNWLARDQWQDPMFNGQYWDFRIWNGSLTAGQVANLYAAGPQAIAGPMLQISPASSNHVTLTWPANATGFTLQSATSLLGTWSAVSGTPTAINGLNTLVVPLSLSQTYYRLTP